MFVVLNIIIALLAWLLIGRKSKESSSFLIRSRRVRQFRFRCFATEPSQKNGYRIEMEYNKSLYLVAINRPTVVTLITRKHIVRVEKGRLQPVITRRMFVDFSLW